MPLIGIIAAIVVYLGIAMAFYFGISIADTVGETSVNACCALSWPLILIICVVIGPFFSFWWLASAIHKNNEEDE